jgi:Uncharacterised protein family (UPF0175)
MTPMDVTLHIPDAFAQRLKAAGGDLSRRALEALALDEYKLGHLTTTELCDLLGLSNAEAVDDFLKAHNAGTTAAQEKAPERHELARAAAQGIREMSKGVKLGGLKIKDLINEGRL